MITEDRTTALQTYDRMVANLPEELRRLVEKHPKDPAPLSKYGTTIMRLRIFPTDRQPAKFWSSDWCFYEIGVGRYPTDRANFGGIQFFMSPEQRVCGDGRHRRGVVEILGRLEAGQHPRFFLNTTAGGKGTAILCGCHYHLGEFPAFPVETAAADLAWLIQNTLRPFAALR